MQIFVEKDKPRRTYIHKTVFISPYDTFFTGLDPLFKLVWPAGGTFSFIRMKRNPSTCGRKPTQGDIEFKIVVSSPLSLHGENEGYGIKTPTDFAMLQIYCKYVSSKSMTEMKYILKVLYVCFFYKIWTGCDYETGRI